MQAYVVFRAHWDREWVQSFEQYRFRLVNLIDNLLDILSNEPGIRFLFDGQTVVIEDYLAIRPEREKELKQYGKQGRILFGPWYILADQFLECEEAQIRNLQMGFKIASEYGKAPRLGYVPDSFGSCAVLPALMNGFNIKHVNFGRRKTHLKNKDSILFYW